MGYESYEIIKRDNVNKSSNEPLIQIYVSSSCHIQFQSDESEIIINRTGLA